MAGDNKVADLTGQGVGTGDGELGNAVVHGGHDFVGADTEGDRDVNIEFGDDQARIRGDGLIDGGVNRFQAGGDGAGVGDDVGHNRGENEAVVLEEVRRFLA